MSIASSPFQKAAINIPSRPDSARLMGDLPTYKQDPLAFWLSTGRQAPVVKIRFGPLVRYIINDPELAQHVLQKNRSNYIKDQRLMKVLEAGGGQMLVTSDGDEWLWRRRLMQPAFHRQQIAHFADTIVAETEKMLATWQSGSLLDVDKAMKTLTMYIIGKTMFNVDFEKDAAALHHAYIDVGKFIVQRVEKLFAPPLWVPTKDNRAFMQAVDTIAEALETIMTARKTNSEPNLDLLAMLFAARLDDSDHQFTEQQLMYEMSAIVFAGHETTATTLTWVLGLLAQYPEVEAKLREELARVLNDRFPTMADFPNLPYLQQVINETMRLYPPLYVISRQAVTADRLGDYELPENGRALINVLGIHHNADYWDNPEAFDPDRFSPERNQNQHKFAFIPFLDGPRKCIGAPLAMAELQLILPMILQRFQLRLPPNQTIEPETAVVLQPKGGLHLSLNSAVDF